MDNKSSYYGFYRAKVVDNKDLEMFGRVLVWVPDLMPKIPDDRGIWALPANNPISGLNSEGNAEHQYSGSVYVPPKGSWILVFFENGNPNRPYYFGGLNLQNTKVLPECQSGPEYQQKWVVYKSHAGRCIVISDDPDDERVEITGKKRQINTPPTGDISSVFTIDGNQTTILLDEREGKEKILVRSHKGDYINFDVENRKLFISFDGEIHVKSNATVFIKATDDINLKCSGNFNVDAGGDVNIKSGGNINTQSGSNINELAGGSVNIDGAPMINENTGSSGTATPANGATPVGDR